VFISYSSTDRAYVQRLAAHLVANEVLVWFDPQIGPGERFADVIELQINECAAVVVVMSRAAAASKWVPREIEWSDRRNKPMLSLLLDGEVFFQYANTQYVDVRNGRLPDERFVAELQRLCAAAPPPADATTVAPVDHPPTYPTPEYPTQQPVYPPPVAMPTGPQATPPPARPGGSRTARWVVGIALGLVALYGFFFVANQPSIPPGPPTITLPTISTPPTYQPTAPPATGPPVQRLASPMSETVQGVTYTLTAITYDPQNVWTTFAFRIANNTSQPLYVDCCTVIEDPPGIQHNSDFGTVESPLPLGAPSILSNTTINGEVIFTNYKFDPSTTSLLLDLQFRFGDNTGAFEDIRWDNVPLLPST
jgi:hypothetical protein